MANQGRLKNLPREKRELLNRLLRERTAPADTIQRRSAGMSRVPMSSGQRRIWFLDRMEPGLPVYQISATLPLGGVVDPEVMERSVNGLVARHESLRTTFTEIDGELFQIIAPELEIRMRMLNLIDLPAATRKAEAARIGSADAAQAFDLETGPLLRVTLIRLDPDHSSLLLTLHHIISDGWSMNVLLRELSIVYEALAAGKPPPLAELPIQYPDFALWQQKHMTAERAETDLAYWRKQLAGAPRLNLPAYSGGAKRTYQGGRAFFSLGAARTRQLEQISVQSGNTLFIILLAAFQTLLGRYSGQDDIVVGTPVAGRTRPETEGLIGFLLNTVCLRTDLSGDPDFLSLLERVRQTAVNAYAHQELPFERVVESLAPDRQTAGSALFNVMFVLQVAQSGRPLHHKGPAPPQPEDWQFENGTAKFDLTLSIAETASGLVGALEYSSDLFKLSTARNMIEHFTTLVDSIAAEPHVPISRLRLISTDEEQRILHEWNATAAPFPAETRVEKLVMEQAARSPDATAIICAEGETTYQELCREANQTARNLLSRGIERGSRIGIFLERGRRLLPALLGTWAAGCAYVPLDTEGPVERTQYILEDANLAAVLTEEHLRDQLPATTRGLICLDREEDVIVQEAGDPLPSTATASDAAYILYTSGSTGKPKGVIVAHRSLVNYLTWTNRVLVGPSPRLLPAITKITFDASLKQLFAPLLRGGAVWLVAEKETTDLSELMRTLSSRGDFALNCVPWLWSALLDTLSTGECSASGRLKQLLVGGEELGPELLKRTFARFPELEVWNLYGPTETTANATAQRLSREGPVLIGFPIANSTVRVLDPRGQLVPVGVAGELHVGGVGVAMGYWGKPDMTAERFIPDPFSKEGRLYKTGDLVQYCEDGSLRFVGRIDRQIKLHGHRIEPGEIEVALARDPAVKEVSVVLVGMKKEQRLAAYIECHNGQRKPLSELRKLAAETLPAYMIPAHFVFLDRLPRGVHGKIDRTALPPLGDTQGEDQDPFVEPRDECERDIAVIWEALLGARRVGVHQSFFELGGHSLLAMQLVSRIRQRFGVEVPLRKLFEAPTVEALAQIVKKPKTYSSKDTLPPIRRLSRNSNRLDMAPTD